jgi:predicted Ser/Thr protein kinase
MCIFVCVESQNILQYAHISFNELVVEKEIGEGSYGKVCLGKWNNSVVALKFCRNKGSIENFAKEIKVMMYVID